MEKNKPMEEFLAKSAESNTAMYFEPHDGNPGDVTVLCTAPPQAAAAPNWSSAVAAISATLSASKEFKDLTLTAPAIKVPDTKSGAASSCTPNQGEVLTELLNAAYAIGVCDAVPRASSHAVLGLRYTDLADGVQVRGVLRLASAGIMLSLDKAGRFDIYTPDAKSKSIVIVITVGGVKVTIIIRW